jgi:hypothetical protein
MSAAVPITPHSSKEERFQYTNLGPLLFGLLVSGVVGLVVCGASMLIFGMRQFLFSWLFAFMFFFTISIGSLFWTLLHYAVDAEWSVAPRRILETMANSFRYLWVFFIPIALGSHKIYEWMNIPLGADPLLDGKRRLLDPTRWLICTAVFFVFYFIVSFLLRRWSTRQDETGDPKYTLYSRSLSFGALPLFGITFTLAAILWVMSINHLWYSTMWGVYLFAGSAWSSMATLILITRALHSLGYLRNVISKEHYHIMGKLLLAFTVFWAYIAFSQFFLIWYANIPEETEYFRQRNMEGWNLMTIGLQVIGHFFVTFVLLLPRAAKTNPVRLSWIAGWVLLMHAADIYIIVMPFLHEHGMEPATVIVDLAALVTIGAPLIFLFLQALGRHSLYPVRDPRLAESLRLAN